MGQSLVMVKNGSITEGSWRNYRLFGFTMASDFHFANRLLPGDGAVDLTFTCVEAPPCRYFEASQEPDYISPYHTPDGQSILHVFRQPEYDVLHFVEVADFYIWPERIVCHLLDPTYALLIEIHFLGRVMAYWLERRGLLALHAAAATVAGRAVAFLESNGGGKTTLAAALVQRGHALLTDDLLPVTAQNGALVGHPGYPQMRMWPEQAEYFLGYYEPLAQIHPLYTKRRVPIGAVPLRAFCENSQPLGCLYRPERCDEPEEPTIIITPLTQQEAFIELVNHSFLSDMVQGLGFQPTRMHLLAQIACKIPVRRIRYPSGYDNLPSVCAAILTDIATR